MVVAFDVLLLAGVATLKLPFVSRRALMHRSFKETQGVFQFAQYIDSRSRAVVEAFFIKSLLVGEGLMCKSLHTPLSAYEPGVRSSRWIKVKKDYVSGTALHDSLDLVPIGAWHGTGRKAKWYSPILVACYSRDTERFQPLCKVMSGFSDEHYQELTTFYSSRLLPAPPSDYQLSASLTPPLLFPPCEVWEIRGADLTLSPVHLAAVGQVEGERGLSLRFPRFMRKRPDKQPHDATTATQLVSMYWSQSQAARK